MFDKKRIHRLLKTISDFNVAYPGSKGIGLSELSCIQKYPFVKLIPYLENYIRCELISIISDDEPLKHISVLNEIEKQKEIDRQIKLLNSAFVRSDDNFNLFILKDNQSISIIPK